MTEKDCEMNFLTQKQAYVIAMCGIKGSSKTFTALNYIKYSIVTKKYITIHFIAPSYKTDADQKQYEFLKHVPKEYNVKIFVYTKYSPLVLDMIVNKTDKTKGRTLVVIDDATSSGKTMSGDENFLHFVTTSRHLDISLILITHSLKNVIAPSVRSMYDAFFIFRVINRKILEGVHEEYFSVFPQWYNFKDWLKMYNDKILSIEYNGMYLDTRNSTFDTNTKKWNMNTYDLNQYFNAPKIDKIKEVNVDPVKDGILMNMSKKEKVEYYKRKILGK